MKIYKDRELTELVDAQTLDLGVGLADESHDYTFYLHNELHADLKNLNFEIKPTVNRAFEEKISSELQILESPKEMASKSIAEIKLQWKPAVDIKSGLKAELHINGFEIWS